MSCRLTQIPRCPFISMYLYLAPVSLIPPRPPSWSAPPSQTPTHPCPQPHCLPATQVSSSGPTVPGPYSDNVEVGLSGAAQGGQGRLKNSPRGSLAAACAAHDHGGVTGVLGFIQLDNLGEGERDGLQAHIPNLLLNGLPQLREGKIQEVEEKGCGL